MHVLYYAPGAASMVVHWLLVELGVPHELVRVDLEAREQKGAAYLALNPSGVVPTLVVDGRPRHEAAALAMHLADAHPAAGLAPALDDPRRIEYLQWMFHLANAVQPLLRQWWYPHEPAGADQAAAVREHLAPRLEAAWTRIDDHLAAHGPYLLGEDPCAADFMLVMLMRWSRHAPRPATGWPRLAGLAQRLKARPSFAQLYRREGLTEWS